jgi:hypothetical protein
MKVIASYRSVFFKVSYLLLLCILRRSTPLLSQLPNPCNNNDYKKYYCEKLLIRTDRDLYISGEKVWLKIYKLNGLTGIPENLSKIVYVEVMDSAGNPFAQMKVQIDWYSGSASFRLPDTLRTGNYLICAYTNWMRNFPEDLYSHKTISVINPFILNDIKIPFSQVYGSIHRRNAIPTGQSQNYDPEKRDSITSSCGQKETSETGVYYKINIQKNAHSAREKIIIGILANDRSGNPLASDFSLSVVKAVTINKTSTDNNDLQLPVTFSGNSVNYGTGSLSFSVPSDKKASVDASDSLKGPVFVPELEGHLICGIIKDRITGEPLKNQNISLSYVGKSALCQFSKTNDKGEFRIKTSVRGIREIVVQPVPDISKEFYVELDNPITPSAKKYNRGDFFIDTARLLQINNVIICAQINNMYEPFRQKVIKKDEEKGEHDFFGKPENTVIMSKYIELTSVREVIKEIIPGVSTVKKNDMINFRLFSQNQSKPYDNNPMVLVDGLPVYDFEKVLNIKTSDLEKIDVFITRYYISDIVFDGILHFVTKKGDLGVIDLGNSVYRLEYEFPLVPEIFYTPDYSSSEQLNSHIPDLRNTLFWNPAMQTDNTGKAIAEFYSSDETGEYMIIVEGMNADGKRGTARMSLDINFR